MKRAPLPQTERATTEPGVASVSGPAPQFARVRWTFLMIYALAYVGFWIANQAPLVITLAVRVDALVPEAERAATLGLILGVGAFVGLITNPVVGRLSDRTTAKWGKRRPWILVGAAGTLASAAVMAFAGDIPMLLGGYFLTSVFVNILGAMLIAMIADQIPQAQRGVASGVAGITLPIGLVGGSFLVQALAPNIVLMLLIPGSLAFFLVLPFLFTLRDKRLDKADRPHFGARDLVRTFYVNPRENRDFSWAFASRFMVQLAAAFVTTYLAYYLIDHLGATAGSAPNLVFLGLLALSIATMVAAPLGGKLSDLLRRRKIFVLLAAVIFGIAFFMLSAASTVPAFLAAMAVAGIGYGAYNAVDLALVADVLPDPEDTAKDLGVFNMAATLPQTLAPVIAPIILAFGDGSYGVLYSVGGALGLVGAVAILPVRKAR
ncbi:MFS transporter [Microbacterium sp. QXD-8]|uniref:MFS transporter n=1 Tax=Microbacterium psychrotolerans TaxID=3068321 RepID=A0ABU0YY50_9MICO|nr:MFS transporter [Microbacterium sp. QXD-8]MDQ7876524.1 MFS transporter [Microbacterium sp. QXD-8]